MIRPRQGKRRNNYKQNHGNIVVHIVDANITVRNIRDQEKDTLLMQQQKIYKVETCALFIFVNKIKLGLIII